MRIFPALLFLFLCTNLGAQQKGFLSAKNMQVAVFSYTLAELFESPDVHTNTTLYADDLAHAGLYDFSKLENLETVQIKFTLAPDSSDAARKKFRDSINVCMKNLAAFKKCPKLKKIVFCIGEQVYLTHAQTDVENAYEDKKRQELFDANVKGAWDAFGKDVNKLLPGVKLYAYTWGW